MIGGIPYPDVPGTHGFGPIMLCKPCLDARMLNALDVAEEQAEASLQEDDLRND